MPKTTMPLAFDEQRHVHTLSAADCDDRPTRCNSGDDCASSAVEELVGGGSSAPEAGGASARGMGNATRRPQS